DKLGWFWDLDAQLKGDELVVTGARKIAPVNPKLKGNRKKIIKTSTQKKETPSPTANKPKPIPRRRKQRSQGNPNSDES
ncbi:MAG: hypothetical protein RI580_06925, partial [Halothece sp. Uz-M2-17]|nr:hypothetical protein [Halothece sp. Uz-M2-17]